MVKHRDHDGPSQPPWWVLLVLGALLRVLLGTLVKLLFGDENGGGPGESLW